MKELKELRADIKPYSHNIITLTLGMIANYYGDEEANNAGDPSVIGHRAWAW